MTYGVARAATSPELAFYRSPGKASKWRAAILPEIVVYTAQINQTFSTWDGVLQLVYDNGFGTLANVLPDMTVLVGSTAGDHDIGICRLRDKDTTHFYIGETSDIRFANNQYLTIIADFSLWARHVLISAGVPYMDGGVAYTNQHSSPDPTPIMGSNRALKLIGASVSTQFDGSASYVIGGLSSISAYAWSCATASSSSGTTTATPTFTFNTVGWHLVYLTLTAANGKSYFAVRYVYVWNDTNLPPRAQIGTPRQDVDTGGWEFELTLLDAPDLDTVRDHSLVILFNEDYFNNTQSNIGPVAGAENIEVEGWIAKETITWNPEQGSVRFVAYTAHYWLSQIPAFPDGVEFTTNTPTVWTQFQNLTVAKGLWHFLHWRTTATRVMDVFLPDDTKFTMEVSSLASNLWEQIREMAFLQIYARAGVNAWNQLFIQVHPQLVPEADRDLPTVMTITKADWQGEISFDRVTKPECAVVSLSGVAVNASGVGASYFSLSPGHAYPHYGAIEVQDKLLVASQAQANQLVGLYRGWRNNPYPEIPIAFDADIRLIDCFPRSQCAITIDEADTPRGISYSGNLFPAAVSIVTDPETGYVHREVTFEAETFEDISTNGDIPGGRADTSIPPTPSFPPLPDFPIIIPGTTEPSANGPTQLLLHDTTAGVIAVTNFDTTPVYNAANAGLTSAQYQLANWMGVCPNGAVYLAFLSTSNANAYIARAPSVGGTFTVMTMPSGKRPMCAAVNPLASEQIAFVTVAVGDTNAVFHVGTYASFSSSLTLSNWVSFQGPRVLSYGLGNWLITGFLNTGISSYKINAAGTSVVATSAVNVGPPHIRASTTGTTYNAKNGSNVLIQGTNNLASTVEISSGNSVDFLDLTSGVTFFSGDCDPTGRYIMAKALAGGKGFSSDYGATWGTLGSLPVGHYCYAYAGSPSRWLAAGAVVRYTDDSGVTWITKENSSLTALNAFPQINIALVLDH
jgi:hypothetical protein